MDKENLRLPGLGRQISYSLSVLGPCPGEGQSLVAHLCHSPLPRVVDVSLPRFSITGTYNLKRILSHLGITKIFEEHGDLTKIVPNRSLKVGEVSLRGLGLDAPARGAFTQPRARASVPAAVRARILPTREAELEPSSAPTSHELLGES